MTGTSATVQATCRRSAYRLYRTAGRKAVYGRFSVLPRLEIYRSLCIKDSVKIDPSTVTAQELVDQGVWQAFSFGPGLVENGEISVSLDSEVGRAKASNPRTAIGVIDDLHYVFVVSDGRTDDSEGLSLYELASFMDQLGVQTAYNLDGGGSSTMVFQNQIINNPTGGFGDREREVSDIVYIG